MKGTNKFKKGKERAQRNNIKESIKRDFNIIPRKCRERGEQKKRNKEHKQLTSRRVIQGKRSHILNAIKTTRRQPHSAVEPKQTKHGRK
jgi:hypothetical protein